MQNRSTVGVKHLIVYEYGLGIITSFSPKIYPGPKMATLKVLIYGFYRFFLSSLPVSGTTALIFLVISTSPDLMM